MPGSPTAKHALPTMAGAADLGSTIDDTFNSAMESLDAIIATAITTTPRPAASTFGRFHRAADGTISFDTGSAWVEVARHPHAAKHAAGGSDPLTVTAAMLDADVPLVPVGSQVAYSFANDPPGGKWLLADGRLISAATYPAFDAGAGSGGGHAYNGGVDPGGGMVRIPDKRGRVSMGADSMGTAQGAANRVPNSNRTRGQSGGEERTVLVTANLPSHSHTDGTLIAASAGSHSHTINSANAFPSGYAAVISSGWSQYDSGSTGVGILWGSTTTYLSSAGGHAHSMNAGGAHTHTVTGTTGAEGSGTPHSSMQPYECDNWIVRVA